MDKFISDPHLGHERILDYERTQFASIREHDEFIKNMIRKNVSRDDTLYVLGDVGHLTQENMDFWLNLPCQTILIRGNHDKQKEKLLKTFDVVSDVPIFYHKRVLLSHEPLPVTGDTINIHGHLHGSDLKMPNYINISMHVFGYKMLTSDDIHRMVAATPKESQKFMYEWYAEYYRFTTPNHNVELLPNGDVDVIESRRKLLTENSATRTKYKALLEAIRNDYADPELLATVYFLHGNPDVSLAEMVKRVALLAEYGKD